ncbi:SprB repeat-containing protein, partial [Crocinitomix catalasitica]|nr:SprB repeat-containing protein [Crocinitomix catalasitica]
PAPIEAVATIMNVTADHEGSIEVDVSGGVPPYTFDWNTGSVSDSIGGLPSGNYLLLITDANGCEFQDYYKVHALTTAYTGPLYEKHFIHDALNKKVYIRDWDFTQKELILYNAIGEVICKYRIEIEVKEVELDLPSHIAKGMYIISTPDGEFSEKIIVRKF